MRKFSTKPPPRAPAPIHKGEAPIRPMGSAPDDRSRGSIPEPVPVLLHPASPRAEPAPIAVAMTWARTGGSQSGSSLTVLPGIRPVPRSKGDSGGPGMEARSRAAITRPGPTADIAGSEAISLFPPEPGGPAQGPGPTEGPTGVPAEAVHSPPAERKPERGPDRNLKRSARPYGRRSRGPSIRPASLPRPARPGAIRILQFEAIWSKSPPPFSRVGVLRLAAPHLPPDSPKGREEGGHRGATPPRLIGSLLKGIGGTPGRKAKDLSGTGEAAQGP